MGLIGDETAQGRERSGNPLPRGRKRWATGLSVVTAIGLIVLIGTWGISPKGSWESVRDALLWGNRGVEGGTEGTYNGFRFRAGTSRQWSAVARYASYPEGVIIAGRDNYTSLAELLEGIGKRLPSGSTLTCAEENPAQIVCSVQSHSNILGIVERGTVIFEVDGDTPFAATGHVNVSTRPLGYGWSL